MASYPYWHGDRWVCPRHIPSARYPANQERCIYLGCSHVRPPLPVPMDAKALEAQGHAPKDAKALALINRVESLAYPMNPTFKTPEPPPKPPEPEPAPTPPPPPPEPVQPDVEAPVAVVAPAPIKRRETPGVRVRQPRVEGDDVPPSARSRGATHKTSCGVCGVVQWRRPSELNRAVQCLECFKRNRGGRHNPTA